MRSQNTAFSADDFQCTAAEGCTERKNIERYDSNLGFLNSYFFNGLPSHEASKSKMNIALISTTLSTLGTDRLVPRAELQIAWLHSPIAIVASRNASEGCLSKSLSV